MDIRDGDSDPSPTSRSDSHGTKCAGVIAAVANNSYCTVGVAYNAKLAGKGTSKYCLSYIFYLLDEKD